MVRLDVKIPQVEAGSYTIYIEAGSLCAIWERLEADYPNLQKFVVTDANVAAAGHLATLIGKNSPQVYSIDPPGEASKHIDTVIAIIEELEKAFFGRDTLIVALGGGTVGDIAGFAAAIFKRGVKVVQIPTTTVAQADSSVGGKTGVDSSISKNAFGAFWQPEAVFIDVKTLLTLDDRQYCAGLIEGVKHALIADSEYFEFYEKNVDAIKNRDLDVLGEIALKNCQIKASVVEKDPTEKNLRRILNYGHTIGHAVETASGFELLHGESVAIGIIAAGMIEEEMGLATGRLGRIEQILRKLGVPVRIPAEIDKKQLINIVKRDKKAVNQWPKFVLLEDIGKVLCKNGQWAVDVPRDLVEKILTDLY
ncbi:MAG: 3-dehydroquinate synthase [Planctomycetes bacterium]|nr:3-dehydroquinate synthase [Planctomycetota bacterium]